MLKIINQYPEMLTITKPSLKNGIFYSESRYNVHFIESLISIYKFYFEIDPILIGPEYFGQNNSGSLEFLEHINSGVVIFAYADILFNDIIKINKKRFNTILKNISKKSKVIILSITTLKSLELPILETFHLQQIYLNGSISFKNINLCLFDFDDHFTEMINDFNYKKIYISVDLPVKIIKSIESQLNLKVFRKEPVDDFESGIVLNSSKTTQKTLLCFHYDIYVFILPDDLQNLDLLYYFKDILSDKTKEVYINNEVSLNINDYTFERIITKDSKETFDSVKSIENSENAIMASEEYYKFESNSVIQNMDLRNLSKKEYDIIRNYIKCKLVSKFDLDIKTCQLSTPCSPKDRSRKLNSLSNKINSIDYRCNVTCEIFKDYSIGVIIWNETFAGKEKIDLLKDEIYIYQTTLGKWKYTKVY